MARIGAILAIVVVGLIFIGLFSYPYLHPTPQIDAATNCPVSGPTAAMAIVIDTTDAINPIQKIAIENELTQIRGEVPKFGGLTIYATKVDAGLSRPEFAVCNPGDLTEMDAMTQGKILVQKRWKEGYQEPLSRVLQAMLTAKPATSTPLLEAIQSVSVQTFGPLKNLGKADIPKRLVIVSDLLQHSENLDLYKQIPPVEQFIKTAAYPKIRSDLRDVDVTILFIRRQTKTGQVQALVKFWEDLIVAQGGRVARFKPLEG